jgi:hypothetical protein
MALSDYIPNVFGQAAPSYLQGLLGAEETQNLQNRANVQGLLGAGLALAQGMSRTGPRRSAAENILGALAGGFGAAGGAYEQGVKNFATQQQLGLQARQMAGIQAMKMKYPDLADEFDANPTGAFRLVAEREALAKKPTALSAGQALVSPTGQVIYQAPQDKKKNTAVVGNVLIDLDTGLPIYSAPTNQGKILTPQESQALGLPAGIVYQQSTSGEIKPVEGTKPNSRLLTDAEVTAQNLPTDRNQRYQIDANGKIDLIQGTMLDKEKFTGEYGNLALAMFGTSDVNGLSADQRKKVDAEAERRGISKAKAGASTIYTGQLSKTTAGEVEKSVITTADAVTRLNNIQFSYRPEYQNIGFRTKQAWGTLKDKFGGLSPTEKTQLTNYSQYRQNALQNLNQTIKDITGAAMGVQEAERIIATLPNAGAGIFDGDSPTEFESKLNNGISQTKYALARKNYALRKGLNWENTPLDKMPSIINERGAAIAKQYNLDPKKAADLQTINRQLAAEFGVSF